LVREEWKLLARARRTIEHINRDIAHSRGLTPDEADVAARIGLIDREQRWWWTESWQRGEQEVERALRAGRIRSFASAEELIRHLRGLKRKRTTS
jgi:hypothetical protein